MKEEIMRKHAKAIVEIFSQEPASVRLSKDVLSVVGMILDRMAKIGII